MITEDQSIIMFGRERPTKKQAREAGIRYWKQFNKNRKLTKLYSSSDDDADESKDEVRNLNCFLLSDRMSPV